MIKKFKDITIGTRFIYEKELYMKIGCLFNGKSPIANAVCLTGETMGSTEVFYHAAEVLIDPLGLVD